MDRIDLMASKRSKSDLTEQCAAETRKMQRVLS